MTVPATIESAVVKSIEKTLRDGSLGTQIIEPGGAESATSADEDWIEVHLLSLTPETSRANRLVAPVLFQVTCTSRTMNLRTDLDRMRPYKMAGAVRTLLQPPTGKGIEIAESDGSGTIHAYMSISRIDQTYINERQAGIAGAQGVPSRPSNLHAVALTCTGALAV